MKIDDYLISIPQDELFAYEQKVRLFGVYAFVTKEINLYLDATKYSEAYDYRLIDTNYYSYKYEFTLIYKIINACDDDDLQQVLFHILICQHRRNLEFEYNLPKETKKPRKRAVSKPHKQLSMFETEKQSPKEKKIKENKLNKLKIQIKITQPLKQISNE